MRFKISTDEFDNLKHDSFTWATTYGNNLGGQISKEVDKDYERIIKENECIICKLQFELKESEIRVKQLEYERSNQQTFKSAIIENYNYLLKYYKFSTDDNKFLKQALEESEKEYEELANENIQLRELLKLYL